MLRPLPKSMRGACCNWCNRNQSSWSAENPLGEEAIVYICSLCVLYRSEWGQKQHGAVTSGVIEIEKARGQTFDRNKEGKLEQSGQADHVLGVLVLMDRVGSFYKVADDLRGAKK